MFRSVATDKQIPRRIHAGGTFYGINLPANNHTCIGFPPRNAENTTLSHPCSLVGHLSVTVIDIAFKPNSIIQYIEVITLITVITFED